MATGPGTGPVPQEKQCLQASILGTTVRRYWVLGLTHAAITNRAFTEVSSLATRKASRTQHACLSLSMAGLHILWGSEALFKYTMEQRSTCSGTFGCNQNNSDICTFTHMMLI